MENNNETNIDYQTTESHEKEDELSSVLETASTFFDKMLSEESNDDPSKSLSSNLDKIGMTELIHWIQSIKDFKKNQNIERKEKSLANIKEDLERLQSGMDEIKDDIKRISKRLKKRSR